MRRHGRAANAGISFVRFAEAKHDPIPTLMEDDRGMAFAFGLLDARIRPRCWGREH